MPHSATRGALLPHAWRVEVFRREGVHDPEGVHALGGLREAGAADLASVRAGRGYLLPPELAREDVDRLVRELLLYERTRPVR